MKRLILLMLLLAIVCLPAHAAISRDGSCSAASSSCTLSAVATGDLKIIFAYRNASTTAPSLPASFTSVFVSTGGATNSFRVYCSVASSSGDTGTGTATNATGIVAVAYTGTAATTTAACATQAVTLGVIASANQQSGTAATTATYSGLTTSSGTTSSWIVGFMGDTVASDNCTPTGMTSVTSAGQATVSDTNAAVATWTQVTCTVTSATYRTFVLEVLAADSGAGSGTPSLVQVMTNHDWIYSMQAVPASGGGGGIASGETLWVDFPNPTKQGNMGVLVTGIDHTATPPTITDDKNNSWFLVKDCNDTTNGEDILLYVAPNMAPGTVRVTTLFNANAPNSGPADIAEFTNVALSNPLDVTACTFSASNTVAAGSATPTVTNDLVIQYAWNDYSNIAAGGSIGIHYTVGSQSNITWAKFIDGYWWGAGAQWGVYASTAALNAQMTEVNSGTAGYVSLAGFFRRSSSGTAASGMRVIAAQDVPNGTSSPFNATSITTYFPCPSTANLMAANYSSGNHDLTTISDSHSNTWTSNHAKFCDSGNNTCVHTYSARGSTLSADMDVVLTFDAAAQDTTMLYCITGAATAPFDSAVNNSGQQTVAGNLTLFPGTVTPSTSNGIVLVTGSQGQNTTINFTNSSFIYTGCFESNENLSLGGCAANNAWGVYNNPNTTSETWTATMQSGTIAANFWAAQADIYKAPSGVSTVPQVFVIHP